MMSPSPCPWRDLNNHDDSLFHDQEWGVPVHDDRTWFKFLSQESAQARHSWYTVRRKKGNYQHAFCNFANEEATRFGEPKSEMMLQKLDLILNRTKFGCFRRTELL